MRVHVISHTHWDREWYLTYEQFRLRLVGLVDRLLDLLESRPDFEHFHLDGQTIVLEDYLELRPQNEQRLRTLIEGGRILIGPWYDMPDEFLVSGEALVRNLALGHRISRTFGAPMPVGYLPDLFGHVAQMPQILRNFGLDNAILWRGFGGANAEYWWQAPDGSRVLMMHLPPDGYCNATRVHLNPEQMIDRATRAARAEAARTAVGEVLLMNGVDHVEPHPVIPELVRRLADALGAPVHHSTLPAYVDAIRSAVQEKGVGRSLEVIEGELRGGEDYANLLPGVFSARIYIKQANARVQTLLEKRAEPLATFASMLGARYPKEELQYAWKTLLQNHPHDSICGCSIDAVHDENMTRFARAEQVARAVQDEAVGVIARAVPAGPDSTLRLVAINTTGTPFSGVLDAIVDLPYESAEPRRVFDTQALDTPVRFWSETAGITSVLAHDGKKMPFQVVGEDDVVTFVMSRYDTPWALKARRARLLFTGDVPACGYSTFDVAITESPATRPTEIPVARTTESAVLRSLSFAIKASDRSAENTHVRISINDDGTVDVVDRKTGTRYARCGELEDVGDVGDEYNFSPPQVDRRVTSADATGVTIARVHAGPLRAAFRIELRLPVPLSASADRSSRAAEIVQTPVTIVVSLDADAPRVNWNVVVDNQASDHRLRLLFPVGADRITHVRAETAFGIAKRPARRERPADVRVELPVNYAPTISFTEAGRDDCGAVILGDGLVEYEATEDQVRGALLGLTLLRSVGWLSRDDLVTRPSGHAGPGLATPGAQCLGRHAFRVAFEPRQKAPPGAALYARSASFVAPPLVVPAAGAGGSLSASGSFVTLDAAKGGVVLSALQRSEDGTGLLIRVFNPDDTRAGVRLTAKPPVTRGFRVDFLEKALDEVNVRGGVADFEVGPHGITTLKLE